jgi:hypothetical protein
MTRPLLLHLFFMILGYALAVPVASTITTIVMIAPTVLPDQGKWGSFYLFMDDFPGWYYGGMWIAAIYAFPGWIVSVITAEIRKEQRKYWFAAAGVLTVLLAFTFTGFGRRIMTDPMIMFSTLIGGFFGGLVYWAMAGRRSGNWRNPTPGSTKHDAADEGAPQ